jgi:iron complex outermembrane receptor protein
LDFQRLRDERVNFGNDGGAPTGPRSLDQVEQVTEFGPFVQSSLELSRALAVTAGARYDRVSFRVRDRLVSETNPDDSGDRVMEAVSGSLGASVLINEGLSVYANVGSTFETPTTTELANQPDTAGGFNAALEPQRAWSTELGVRGLTGALGENAGGFSLSWSVAAFRIDVRDLLVSFEVPGSPQRRFFRNAGRARHLGLEAATAARLGDWVDLQVAWTYSRFRYVDFAVPTVDAGLRRLDGQALPGIPEHWVRLMGRVRPAFLTGAWAELEQTYSSEYGVDDTAAVRAPAWTVTNLRAGWDGWVGDVRVSPFFGINNLFNRHYVGSVVINAARGRYFEPAPGRNAYVGVTIQAGRQH